MTTYHPTSDQAAVPLQRLLENENKEIADLVIELRHRAFNRAKLEVSLALLSASTADAQEIADEDTQKVIEILGRRPAGS
jgi:hypothetical protein